MRLMPKKEIFKAKAVAQKQAIDEGVKLAKRVDRLRETAADEEKALEEFRVKTIKAVHDDIGKVAVERETLLAEVTELENRKKEALVPLTSEWEAIAVEKRELEELRKAIEWKMKHEDAAREEARTLLNDARSTNERARTREDESIRLVTDAIQHQKNAHAEAELATIKQNEKQGELSSAEADIKERLKNLDLREQALAKREVEVENSRKENEITRVRLEDREQTLKREFERLKKK